MVSICDHVTTSYIRTYNYIKQRCIISYIPGPGNLVTSISYVHSVLYKIEEAQNLGDLHKIGIWRQYIDKCLCRIQFS